MQTVICGYVNVLPVGTGPGAQWCCTGYVLKRTARSLTASKTFSIPLATYMDLLPTDIITRCLATPIEARAHLSAAGI